MANQLQKPLKILLIGDSCYDEYHYGSVSRISPEAPVPVFDLIDSEVKEGMAYNVYENLKNLGVSVDIITSFSERKNRYLDSKTGQQLLRVDQKIKPKMVDTAEEDYSSYDAVVISDYCKGFVSYEDISKIRKEFTGPIFIDTKKTDLEKLDGCYVKINQFELAASTSLTDELIVTYGSKKVEYKNNQYIPPLVETHDVCGAGDTFLASLVYNYCNTGTMDKAIAFAMKAAAVTVQHIGVYAPTLQEIENAA